MKQFDAIEFNASCSLDLTVFNQKSRNGTLQAHHSNHVLVDAVQRMLNSLFAMDQLQHADDRRYAPTNRSDDENPPTAATLRSRTECPVNPGTARSSPRTRKAKS